jgi:3-phosphoshikimate 1-carboxyvinyltransferase
MANVTIKKTLALHGQVCAPSSKSYTQRMLIASALAHGRSKISKPLLSEDTDATLRAVTALGAKVKTADDCWIIDGANPIKAPQEPIDCGESGATLRFMVPIAALSPGPSILQFQGSLERRPIEPLLESLNELGAKAHLGKQGVNDAVFVDGSGIRGGKTSIAGNVSSQFISGLMFACPLAENDTEITLTSPLESTDYVKMTEAVLSKHAIAVGVEDNKVTIPSKQKYKSTDETVPGDFSSAAFLLAAAAITNSHVQVTNLDYESVQGDKAILRILKEMGVDGKVCRDSVEITGSIGALIPLKVDAKNVPDLVPVFAALACYAEGTTIISGAARLRLKESDRLQALGSELSKMGAEISVTGDGLTVNGGLRLHGATVDSHNDHRIAMACAVAALCAEGETIIQNAECIRKSYPQFFNDLKAIGAEIIGGKLDR